MEVETSNIPFSVRMITPPEDRPDQDREKRTRLDQRVPADQLVFMQVIGENAVLERTEERRLGSHEEQHDQHQIGLARQKSGNRQAHDQDLGQFDEPYQAGFLELVGELTGRRGEKKKRQN